MKLHMIQRVWLIIKQQKVLAAAFFCAVASAMVIPPSEKYWQYMNVRILVLLFCLMLVIAALEQQGVFRLLAQKLLQKAANQRQVVGGLVFLPFWSATVITNDVALITFVPFAILVLRMVKMEDSIPFVIVWQTIAANIGSMLTPVGNPQNLYLYQHYHLSLMSFLQQVGGLFIVSLIVLWIGIMPIAKTPIRVDFEQKARIKYPKRLPLNLGLFLLCLFAVVRLVPYPILLLIVLAAVMICQRDMLWRVDYGLLATFICFFVFVGNIGQIEPIAQWLSERLDAYPLMIPILASQFISNVPAAVLLSGFTEHSGALLLGVNIGGLGTLVASMASLISYQYYMRAKIGTTAQYLKSFTIWNIVVLAILVICTILLSRFGMIQI